MKLKITVLCGLALTGFSGFSSAADRVFGDGVLPEPLEIYDVDPKDGKLDEEERQAMAAARKARHEEARSQWDTDGVPGLSEAERTAARAALRAMIEEKRNARFNEADTDDDGALSPTEFAAIPAFARLLAQRPERVDALYAHLDKNGEGGITLDEFRARLGGRQDGAPRPGDGGQLPPR